MGHRNIVNKRARRSFQHNCFCCLSFHQKPLEILLPCLLRLWPLFRLLRRYKDFPPCLFIGPQDSRQVRPREQKKTRIPLAFFGALSSHFLGLRCNAQRRHTFYSLQPWDLDIEHSEDRHPCVRVDWKSHQFGSRLFIIFQNHHTALPLLLFGHFLFLFCQDVPSHLLCTYGLHHGKTHPQVV